RTEPEYELLDTGVFEENRYFDVFVEYAKAAPEDILIRVTVANRGSEAASIDVLPTVWFRNTWSWGLDARVPQLADEILGDGKHTIRVSHFDMAERWLLCDGSPELLFTDNETNFERVFGVGNRGPYVKDGINDFLVAERKEAVNPEYLGTKASAHYRVRVDAGQQTTIRLRLTSDLGSDPFGDAFDELFQKRRRESDEFYQATVPKELTADEQLVQRQAFAGLLWGKQFYQYNVRRWLRGDPAGPEPPRQRRRGRNSGWLHLNNADVISMPDKWEYPGY